MIRSNPLITTEELQCLLADDSSQNPHHSLPARLAMAGTSWLMGQIRRLTLRG